MSFDKWIVTQTTGVAACDHVTYGRKVWDAAISSAADSIAQLVADRIEYCEITEDNNRKDEDMVAEWRIRANEDAEIGREVAYLFDEQWRRTITANCKGDEMNDCSICGKPIDDQNLFVSDGDGGHAHGHCHERRNPPKMAATIFEAARGFGDSILAARVIKDLVPHELAEQIIAEFNRRSRAQWQRRCEE